MQPLHFDELERCGAESFEQNSLAYLLTDLGSLCEYVVKFVHSQNIHTHTLKTSRRINFGIGPIFKGKSATARFGLITSHHYT